MEDTAASDYTRAGHKAAGTHVFCLVPPPQLKLASAHLRGGTRLGPSRTDAMRCLDLSVGRSVHPTFPFQHFCSNRRGGRTLIEPSHGHALEQAAHASPETQCPIHARAHGRVRRMLRSPARTHTIFSYTTTHLHTSPCMRGDRRPISSLSISSHPTRTPKHQDHRRLCTTRSQARHGCAAPPPQHARPMLVRSNKKAIKPTQWLRR